MSSDLGGVKTSEVSILIIINSKGRQSLGYSAEKAAAAAGHRGKSVY